MRLLRGLERNFEKYLVAAILLVLVVTLIAQVFCRYFIGAPLVWSEELARYLLIWCTFLGVSLAVREGRNISVDLAPAMLGPRTAKFFVLVALMGSAMFFTLMVWYGIPLTQRIAMIGQSSPGLGLPMWMVYAAVPVGLGLALLRSLQAAWLLLRNWNDKDTVGHIDPVDTRQI